MQSMIEKPKDIYFTGGSYTVVYQLGAGSYLAENHDLSTFNWYGCSAGSLAAVMLFLYPSDEILKTYLYIVGKMTEGIQKNPFDLNDYNLTGIHFEVLKYIHEHDSEAYKKINGKINIGVTTPDGFRWYNTFNSNKELFNILLNGFHVPILCKYKARIEGKKCMDGGFGMDFREHLPKNTLIVCPRVDVHAQLNGYMPDINTVIPPTLSQINYYYEKGRNDMKNYMEHGKTTGPVLFVTPNEFTIPISVWQVIRLFQIEDESYDVNIFK
jgi:hypothetical protein